MSTPGQGLRFSDAISGNDHGAYISLTAALSFSCSILFYVFRLYTRIPLRSLFKRDDGTVTGAILLAIAQFSTIIYAVQSGLGERLDAITESKLENVYKAAYAADLLYLGCLFLARLAIVFLIQRLTRTESHILVTNAIAGVLSVWAAVTVVLVAVPCNAALPWNSGEALCSSLSNRWTAVVIGNVLCEVAMLVLPVYLVWNVQIPRSAKIIVALSFWFRIPVLVFSILRLVSLRNLASSPDFTFDSVEVAVYAQLELHTCLISASVPCMRPFLRAFDTGYWGTTAAQVDATVISSSKGGKGSLYAMQSMSLTGDDSKTPRRPRTGGRDDNLGPLRPEAVDTVTVIEHVGYRRDQDGHADECGSTTSQGSDKMIIKKTTDVRVVSVDEHALRR